MPETTTWRVCRRIGTSWPRAIAHSPDGTKLLIGHGDGRVFVAAAAGGNPLAAEGFPSSIGRVTFSADGQFWAALGDDAMWIRRAQDTAAQAFPVGVRGGSVLRIAPAAPDLLLVAGAPDPAPLSGATGEAIQVWKIGAAATMPAATLLGQFHRNADVAFAPDGRSLVLLEGGKILQRADFQGLPTGPAIELRHHIDRAVFSPDGSRLAGVTSTDHLVVYDLEGELRLTAALQLKRPERVLFLGPAMDVLVLAGSRADIVPLAGEQSTIFFADSPLVAVDPAPDGASLAGVTPDGTLTRVSITSAALPAPATIIASSYFWSLSISSDLRYLATATTSLGTVWDFDTARSVRSGPTGIGVRFSLRGLELASTGNPNGNCALIRPIDARWTGDVEIALGGDLCASSVAAPPMAELPLAGSSVRGIGLYAEDGRQIRALRAQPVPAAVGFSPDGRWLASSANQLWATDDWNPRWAGTPDPYVPATDIMIDATVAFSPDSAAVLISNSYSRGEGGRGGPVWHTSSKLRSVETGDPLRDFGQTLDRRPSFSPDGAWITAGARVSFWRTGTERALDDANTSVSQFLPDGRIIGGSASGVVTVYCPE